MCDQGSLDTDNHTFLKCQTTERHRIEALKIIRHNYGSDIRSPWILPNETQDISFTTTEQKLILLGFIPKKWITECPSTVKDREKRVAVQLISITKTMWSETRKMISKAYSKEQIT